MAVNSKTKVLTGADRAEFIRRSKACANPSQLARIVARLAMNKFVLTHTEAVCQATYDDIMKKAKR